MCLGFVMDDLADGKGNQQNGCGVSSYAAAHSKEYLYALAQQCNLHIAAFV